MTHAAKDHLIRILPDRGGNSCSQNIFTKLEKSLYDQPVKQELGRNHPSREQKTCQQPEHGRQKLGSGKERQAFSREVDKANRYNPKKSTLTHHSAPEDSGK